ncbi:MAG: glutathione peroxidase [Ignavibacteriales bacterium CG_4_9_14_3_um_filter_30_11]|nr:MAG: glutathione peroxidase [Ignavibacteriales bacterium CG_4_9_14_3_um_filter_30_11]
MKKILLLTAIICFSLFTLTINSQNNIENNKTDTNIYNFTVKNIDKKDIKLDDYKGKVLLIVNVASQCGYTPQYKGLEAIYEKYKAQGFEILAFPCNDFGKQEPGTNEEIKNFCSANYSVTFPLFNKIKVLGDEKEALYNFLTNNTVTGSSDIKWNFEKFLIDRNGNIVTRFRSKIVPEGKEITSAIETELKKG